MSTSLLATIDAFHAGCVEFNAGSYGDDREADSARERTFGGPLTRLRAWATPATTCAEAIAAIRLARDEDANFGDEAVVGSMLNAALAYFDDPERKMPNTKYINLNEAMGRVGDLLNEAAAIIRDNPELKIDRIAANQHGVHTFLKIPALAQHGYLTNAIAKYHEAQAVWRSLEGTGRVDDSREWNEYEAAEDALLFHPCRNLDDVREKVRFLLSDDNALHTLQNGFSPAEKTSTIVPFLRSLLGEAVNIGGN